MRSLGQLWSSQWLRWVVSGGLLVLVLSYVDPGEAWQVIRNGRPDLILTVFVLLVAIRFFSAYRWWVLLRCGNATISFGEVVRITFLSVFVGAVMPSGVGVEVVRIYGATRATSDLALSFSSVLVERALALLALTSLVLLGLIAAPADLPRALSRWAWLGLFLLAFGAVILMHSRPRRATDALVAGYRWLTPVRTRLAKLYARLDDFAEQPWLVAWLVALAFAFQFMRVLVTAIGAWALGVDLPLATFVALVPIVVLVGLIPITIAGLGVTQAAYVSLFGLVGVSAEAAFALSMMIYLLNLLTALPGAFFLARYRGARRDLERAADLGP